MYYPGQSISEQPRESLSTLLVREIASEELQISGELNPFSPPSVRIAQLLGSACLEKRFAAGNLVSDRTDTARGLTPEIARQLDRVEQHRLELHQSMYDLASPNGAFNHNRVSRHESVIHAVSHVLSALKPESIARTGNYAELAGFMHELTVIAAINRLQHPWMTAVLAPIHHDERIDDPASNYDVLVAISTPFSKTPPYGRVAKLQIKSTQRSDEKRYNPDIHVLYADQVFLPARKHILGPFGAAKLILNEHDGTIKSEQVASLDKVTENIIWDL